MAKLKAVLAGASGFLGRTLQERLAADFEIYPLQRPYPEEAPRAAVLFHVAGLTHGRTAAHSSEDVCEINTGITRSLIRLAQRSRIPRIVFAGSYVYGIPKRLPVAETDERVALSPYMKSKILCEDMLEDAVRSGALQTAISLRLFNVYGPGQPRGLLIPDILAQLAHGEILLGDDRPGRDFVHSFDVADAFAAAATVPVSPFETINIGSGSSARVAQVVEIIRLTYGAPVAIRYNRSERAVDIPDVVADIRKAKDLLHWHPRVSFETGLRQLVQAILPSSAVPH